MILWLPTIVNTHETRAEEKKEHRKQSTINTKPYGIVLKFKNKNVDKTSVPHERCIEYTSVM